tara:strand:+ start:465 stop:749 length:285 start_codon:yes stop_codon:yes gene_type:complete
MRHRIKFNGTLAFDSKGRSVKVGHPAYGVTFTRIVFLDNINLEKNSNSQYYVEDTSCPNLECGIKAFKISEADYNRISKLLMACEKREILERFQ